MYATKMPPQMPEELYLSYDRLRDRDRTVILLDPVGNGGSTSEAVVETRPASDTWEP